MSHRISNERIDELYAAARAAGALGGQGDRRRWRRLPACCTAGEDRKHDVAAKMSELGASVEEFAFEHSGLRTWRVGGDD